MDATGSPSQSARLTVAIIAQDSADALRTTLDSVRFAADEVLLVDVGDRDHLRADDLHDIAAQFQAQILPVPWNDDLSAPRNLALARAQGDWVLWLEPGETLAADEAGAIQRFIREHANPARAYVLLIDTTAERAGASFEQAGQIRLLPNRAELRFTGRVRERIQESLAAQGIELESLPWRIHRSAREHDPLVKAVKARRDLQLAQLQLREGVAAARMLNVIGDAHSRLGDMAAATEAFRQALAKADRGSLDMLEAYYGLLAAMDSSAGQRPEQIAICLSALEQFPLDGQLLCAMGSYLQQQSRLDLAARAYQTAAEHGQIEWQLWHLADLKEVATVCWSMCLQLLDRMDEARRALEAALADDGAMPRIRRQLIELYVKLDLRKEALEQVQRLPSDTPKRDALRTAVRGACLASRQQWPAALGYLQTAYSAGCRDPLCLRWLTVTLLALGDFSAVEPVLLEWQQHEPLNPEVHRYLETIGGPSAVPPPHGHLSTHGEPYAFDASSSVNS